LYSNQSPGSINREDWNWLRYDPHHLAFRNLPLGDHGALYGPVDTWRAAARQLAGAKASQYREFKGIQMKRSMHHE
jgi:hypothetical protein